MENWTGKVVVVTGGSSGLGRAIAADFLSAGADVVCLARDEQKLIAVVEQLQSVNLSDAERSADNPAGSVSYIVADVTDDASVASAIGQLKNRHGQIDVWVNNVGRSLRIAFAEAKVADYRELMEINFFSAVRCTEAVLPLLDRTSGHLVNVGSLASKTGWPLVAPYTTSKHALAAYHHQLRLEGPRSVHYLFVCPGPIARSDSTTRYADQAAGLEDQANQPGAGVKLKGISPDVIAEKIRVGCERRKADLVIPGKARIAFAIAQLSARTGDWLLKKFSSSKS